MTQITLYTGGGVTFSPNWAAGRTESDYIRLVADDDMMLKKGDITTLCADVLKTDAPNWSEVPYIEANPEPEHIPAWDISQAEYFNVGDLVARDGVTYRCINGHYAAWAKQPPNDSYWEVADNDSIT
jgi:hypothetical protein